MQSALGSSVFVQLRGGRTGLAVQACRDLHVNRVTSDTGASPGNYARVSPQSRVAARSLLAATRAVQGEGSGGPDDTRNPAIGHFARNVQNTIKLFRLVPGGGVEPPWPQGPADFESAASASSAIPAYEKNYIKAQSEPLLRGLGLRSTDFHLLKSRQRRSGRDLQPTGPIASSI